MASQKGNAVDVFAALMDMIFTPPGVYFLGAFIVMCALIEIVGYLYERFGR